MNTVDEIKESCKNNINEKISSPFYGTFIVSWLLWNWKVWYITFFVDSNLINDNQHILKVDYISNIYKFDSFWSFIFTICHILILPFLSSLLIVYLMPKITCKFYNKSLETDNANKLSKARKDAELLNALGAKLEAQKEVIKKEQQIGIEKKKLEKSQEELWDEEYEKFKKTRYFVSFNIIKQRIYENGGYIRSSNFSLPSDITAFYHANDIIEGISESGDRIKITEKGKYFIKKYAEEN